MRRWSTTTSEFEVVVDRGRQAGAHIQAKVLARDIIVGYVRNPRIRRPIRIEVMDIGIFNRDVIQASHDGLLARLPRFAGLKNASP